MKQFFNGFKKGMESFGKNISTIINTAMLLVAYLFGLGLVSIFAKLVGKHFFEKKISGKSTYWSDSNLKKKSIKEHYKQF